MKILIVGNGTLGNRCKNSWSDAVISVDKIYSVENALKVIDLHQPDVVLNAAGVRGKPNVDWCEAHQLETVVGNTKLPIILAEACQQRGIYLLHIGSGCIFYGSAPDPRGWWEDDFGNPIATYSKAKWAADLTLSTLPNTGIARIRMPIDHTLTADNLIVKLASFPQVIDVENSITVVDDMVEVFRKLLEKKATGIYHVTNPGTIKHREIIALYEQLVDPKHANTWIGENDLVTAGLALKNRSNNFLQSKNLEKLGIVMRPVKEAIVDTMKKFAENKKLETSLTSPL